MERVPPGSAGVSPAWRKRLGNSPSRRRRSQVRLATTGTSIKFQVGSFKLRGLRSERRRSTRLPGFGLLSAFVSLGFSLNGWRIGRGGTRPYQVSSRVGDRRSSAFGSREREPHRRTSFKFQVGSFKLRSGEREFRSLKSDFRKKSEGRRITSVEVASPCSLACVKCFGFRSSDFFRVSGIRVSFGFCEFGLLTQWVENGTRWNASLPGFEPGRRPALQRVQLTRTLAPPVAVMLANSEPDSGRAAGACTA